jgi:hypothetical protein
MNKLVLPVNEMNEFDLPRVCIVTGQTEGVVFKDVKFSWYPRWVVIFVLVNVLLAAIIGLILTKKAKGQLPFTEEAWKKWKQGQLFFGLSCVMAILTFVGGISMMAAGRSEFGVTGVVLTFAVPITIWARFVRNKGPMVERIDDGQVTLKIPSDFAADAISRHLVAGQGTLKARGSMGAQRSA